MNQIIQQWIDDKVLNDTAEIMAWRQAASRFRLPYWDWAQKQKYSNSFGISELCTLDTVDIIEPGGKEIPYDNPLVSFTNPTGVAMGDPSMEKNAIKDHKNPPYDTLPVSQGPVF